jgi:hypothetical protein
MLPAMLPVMLPTVDIFGRRSLDGGECVVCTIIGGPP